MATVRYTGNSQIKTQLDTVTVVSPVSGSSVYTVTVNGKVHSYTAQSSVAATVAEALAADIAADQNIKELGDSPAAYVSGADVLFTANNPGQPFTNAYAQTTGGGGTWNSTATTSNSGPGVFDAAANWTSTPGIGDALVLSIPNVIIGWRLDQITAAIASFTMMSSFNGQLGLPIQNTLNYPEYRGCYAKLACPLFVIGVGDGLGCSRAYIEANPGSAAVVIVYNTGASQDGYPTVMIKHTAGGGNSFSSVRVVDGSVGIALLPAETSTVTLLTVGDDNTNPTVSCGVGVSLTTLNISSGTVNLVTSASGATSIVGGATLNIANGGAMTSLSVDNGTCVLGGTGNFTITDLAVGGTGTLDLSKGTGTVTVTNGIVLYAGFTIIDPLGRLASSTVLKPQKCLISDGTYTHPNGKTFTIS